MILVTVRIMLPWHGQFLDKDRKHDAYSYKYHLIDLLRLSKFTFAENQAQKWENYKYTFNRRTFLLQNGLYIAIILYFCCVMYHSSNQEKGTPLLTYNNILNILQQASPRMFLALGVAGLILLYRNGSFGWTNGWYGNDNRNHYHASG